MYNKHEYSHIERSRWYQKVERSEQDDITFLSKKTIWKEYAWSYGEELMDVYEGPSGSFLFSVCVESPFLEENFRDAISSFDE